MTLLFSRGSQEVIAFGLAGCGKRFSKLILAAMYDFI